MPKQTYFTLRLLIALCLLALGSFAFAQAEESENLLVNPGFEEPFIAEGTEDLIAEGWQAWSAPPLANRPLFTQATLDETRVIEGESAQMLVSFLSAHAAGLYQTVEGIEPGVTLEFAVNVYVWSSRDLSNPDISVDPADVVIQVGIDPTGDTDPDSIMVIWSDPVSEYDVYNTYSVSALAVADTVTVFVRSIAEQARLQTEVYIDGASLAVVDPESLEPIGEGEMIEETPESTEEPAPLEPTEDPAIAIATAGQQTLEAILSAPTVTPTEEPTAEEPLPLPTEEPTEEPTAQPTEEPTVEPSPVPTEEPTSEPSPVPTEEPTVESVEVEPTEAPVDSATVPESESTLIALATAGQETLEAVLTPGAAGTQAVDEVVAQIMATEAPPVDAPDTVEAETVESGEVDVDAILSRYPLAISYTVQSGDTVAALAQTYSSRISDILAVNGLDTNGFILPGQILTIPAQTVPTPVPLPANTEPYVIQPGDTLSVLARRFDTSVAVLVGLNGIVNANSLRVGQVIQVPQAGSPLVTATPEPPTMYVVQAGDTLYLIAVRFNVTVRELAELNNIRNINRIYRGQVLRIP